jgi:hypothetical protein
VHQQVGAVAQRDGRVVVDAEAVGTLAEGGRAVIRKVGQRAFAVADPVAERAASFVRDLQRVYRKALELIMPWLDGIEGPVVAELRRADREMRGRDRPCQQFFGVHSLLRQVHVDPVAGNRAAAKEGHAVCVVPVQVAEQDGAAERLAAQRERQLLQPRAGIQDDGRRFARMGQRDTSGVSAIA